MAINNALVLLTNNKVVVLPDGTRTYPDLAFEVDIAKPVKFVSKLVLRYNTATEISVETIIPMVLFDKDFQNAIANGDVAIVFAFTTSNGVASTASRYLANISTFLAASGAGWLAS